MPRILNFYMDDSGTRAPDRKLLPYNPMVREFFALGGVLINEDDEGSARKLYDDFCVRWSIGYPLHSVEIRHAAPHHGDFSIIRIIKDMGVQIKVTAEKHGKCSLK
jgi:hypothetical protein